MTAEKTGTPEENLVFPEGSAVRLEPFVTGVSSPIGLYTHVASDRYYVPDQIGIVHVSGPHGLKSEPFLDDRDELVDGIGNVVDKEPNVYYEEGGLLGRTLRPNFTDDRRLYVRYSCAPRSGTPENYDHTDVVAEYRVADDYSQVVSGGQPY